MLECGLTSEDDANLLRIFPGRSQLAELMRCFDWLQTDLGAPQNWPPNLRIAISLCLTSRFPILLWWGQSLTVLYNDAYVSFLGEVKHPFCLGRPGRECWPEIWDTIGPMLENVLRTGEATWSDDFLFFFNRKVPREEVHVRFTYSPILASDGRHVDGVFTPCTEITEEVISARRLATLRQIGAHTDQSRTAESACRQAASVLAENPMDVPCAAIYLLNKDGVHLTADVLPNGDAFPSAIPWDELGISSWPFEPVIRTRCAIEMDVAPTGAGAHLKSQQWPDPVRRAMVLPIAGSPHSPVVGLLIAGISPRRPFDVQYATFFELVAQHIGTRLADVRAYEDERERADALTKLDEAKTAFFSNVSHEFRTPLTLMLGPIQEVLARGSGELPADVRGKLELVNRNSERMLKLVNTLLDFSRIEAGRMTARHELTNLASFTAELCSFFRSAIENAGLDFIVNCPPLAGAVYVDRGMWEKIVLNLLSNALKFTFTGNIGLDLVQVDTQVELRVSDTGTGIPKEEIPYLFERFHRVEGARGRTFEGTGIGLALVKELVQLHHGTVRAASGVGEGSVFIVSIPLGRAHLAPDRLGTHVTEPFITAAGAAYVTEALQWGSRQPTWNIDPNSVGFQSNDPCRTLPECRGRVLLADDNADMRDYIVHILKEEFEVQAVGDGQAAMDVVRENQPDIVLSDVMMPRMNGIDLLKALRQDSRTANIGVILISARAGDEARIQSLEAGADEYLVKPFQSRELLARVRNLFALKRSRDALQQELDSHEASLTELTRQLIISKRSLQRSEACLAEAQRLTRTGSCVWNASTRELSWSAEHCRIFGLGPDHPNPTYETFLSIVHPEDRDFVHDSLNRAFLQSDHFAIDYRILLPDKTTRFIYSLGQRWTATSGDSAEFIGTAVDVTEHRRADEERRKLAAIVENSHDFIGFASLEGKPEIVNPWGRKIVGLETENQIRTTSLSDYVAEHQRELLIDGILPFVRRRGPWEGEMLFQNFKTGELIPMLQQIFLVVERETGRPTGFATISRDISQRKHAESAFHRTREYLAEAQRLSHTGSWVWNVSTKDLWWSDEHYRIMGLEPDGSRIPIGDALRMIHPDDLPFAQKELEESFKERREFETRCRVVRPDGTVRHIQSVARPCFDETGKLNEYVGTIIDITERLQSEQKLHTAQADLARMARITMIGEIGAAIVHEVNQPLSALVNDGEACFSWLSSEAPNLLEARTAAGRIVEQATRASEVVSRIQQLMAKSLPQLSTINLNSVIEDVLTLLKYEITRFNIRVKTELQPNLYNVRGDAIQLKQVISNLIMNALEAMKSSKYRELTIESSNQEDVYAEAFVTVKDSGIGIDLAWADQLFKPFFTTKVQGMGIGLAISRSIIEAHGGQLRSVRKAAPGAAFQFSLRAVV